MQGIDLLKKMKPNHLWKFPRRFLYFFPSFIFLILSGCNNNNPLDTAFGTGSATPTPANSAPIGNAALALSPVNFNFGLVSVGQTAAPLTVSIQNVSSVPIYLSSLSGTTDPNFALGSMNCPMAGTPIAAGDSCSAVVNFAPLVGGNLDFQVTAVFGTTPGDTRFNTNVTLTGIGVAQVIFTGLNAINPAQVTTTTVPLTWADASGASSYTLYQSTDGGATYTIAQVLGAGTTSWNMTGLSPNTTYTFKAKAFNALGQADTNSVTQTATTDALGSFSAIGALSTTEGGSVTSGDLGLNCTDARAHYPSFMAITSESDPTAQCVLLTSPYRVQCTPGYHVGASAWSSTLTVSCLLDSYPTAYTQNVTVNVAFSDRAPIISAIGNQNVLAGNAITAVVPVASDPNAFTLTYSCKYDTLVDGSVSASAPNCSSLQNQDGSVCCPRTGDTV